MKIGISGHQNLGSNDVVEWVRAQINTELTKRDFTSGVSSLAEGADQLFAQVVLDLNRSIEAVIPCEHYEEAFSDAKAIKVYHELKARARKTYLLPYTRPSEEAFFEAGKRVVDMSDLMIAVWNGKPAKGLGGTADIVAYARKTRKAVWCINPETTTCEP